MSGNLFLTTMKHVVLDAHNNESFAPPYDKILMTKEELSCGINARKLMERLTDAEQKYVCDECGESHDYTGWDGKTKHEDSMETTGDDAKAAHVGGKDEPANSMPSKQAGEPPDELIKKYASAIEIIGKVNE